MKYHFKVHRNKDWYWAECIELGGCRTQGQTKEKLLRNLHEALNLYLDEPADSKIILPLPKKQTSGKSIVAVSVSPKTAFAFYLRTLRLRRGMTQKEAAKKLGMKNLYSYQRLESSKTANPELATLIRLKEVFPEFSVDVIVSN
ncbi:MAG: helix-turn-helix domain-containing protein [Deltaproteobacteria bacterium]|nr:helix-turn-helix domain-containing protein [Deltaproteobacteria bacterium]